jgi:hypothetical protein
MRDNTIRTSNVYYMAPVIAPEPLGAPSDWARFVQRTRRAWARLRITLVEIRAAIRRPGRNVFSDDSTLFLDRSADLVDRRRPRPTEPACVLDFTAARLRLRPLAQG